MNQPIKNTFKSYHENLVNLSQWEKEIDPKQIKNIPTEEKILYLTFDTCPTNEVDFDTVNWLMENKVPATIFLNGTWWEKNKDKDLSFLKSDQFTIGGHGYRHIRPDMQSANEQIADILKCSLFIKEKLGVDIKHYRSPYGKPNEITMRVLGEMNIQYISWTGHVFDKTHDKTIDPGQLSMDYVRNFTVPGDILIMHINGQGIDTLGLLKWLHNWIEQTGYRFEKL